ncbi:2-polyprenyl-3-methyl-6-methoxy-1,4-benzoquinone monooxygenase [Inhella proteolytica]|uniref:3-demethoxyubiquinol 3-hydroxylase n=1 Tax=Inhella proteolytica TaxID=2795029 RepID=A0A931J0B8_9BURK|nr:2-polyprenyl-3-methyl-6-methoxy-1,4-benzoquinone monooxygenase [Inhella proteolytica]MBH9576026.1 2-polyprenyl-3-methyl-6-methoxy-1,4-benzoquinone monooxygenase [Inhella proteolytica]
MRRFNELDQLFVVLDQGLRTLLATPHAARERPRPSEADAELTDDERREAAALMRVNHVGEVCAQALYSAQALSTRDAALRVHLEHAAQEEEDHLQWTSERIAELGGRTSLLNPLWWGGAFGIGLAAGLAGDRWSLGFVVETERQVEAHLHSHLTRLPAGDQSSRAIVAQMAADEAAHGLAAQQAGAAELPAPIKQLMHMAAKVMTRTAHHV